MQLPPVAFFPDSPGCRRAFWIPTPQNVLQGRVQELAKSGFCLFCQLRLLNEACEVSRAEGKLGQSMQEPAAHVTPDSRRQKSHPPRDSIRGCQLGHHGGPWVQGEAPKGSLHGMPQKAEFWHMTARGRALHPSMGCRQPSQQT